MKKWLSALLALALACSFAGALAEEEPITIELFYSPWASTPHNGVDPYEEYLEEKYGCDFILTPATDFETQLYARSVGGDMPDLILFQNMQQLLSMRDQGIVLDDWTEYLEQMPNVSAIISDLGRSYLTVDGQIVACPTDAGDQKYAFMIRKDWLEALDLSMPTNEEEFLNVLRAFTFDDPDGDGEDNTYGFTSAGGNTGVGELGNLKLFYTAPDFYITEDGEVSHYMLDGGFLKYLQLARTIVSEGLIDPNWYTQGWDERKPNLYAGQYGVCWYPPVALTNENLTAADMQTVIDRWTVMPMFQGKLPAQPIVGALRSVSAEAAQDPEKMAIITAYLDDCVFPSEEFFIVREGYLIDGYDVLIEMSDGVYYLGMSSPDNERLREYGSIMYGWGQMVQSSATEVNYFFGEAAEPSALNLAQAEMITRLDSMELYDNAYRLLNPDPTLLADSNALIAEFEIDFILGNVDEEDYDAFVEEWMNLYGQTLLDDATETFREYGLLA